MKAIYFLILAVLAALYWFLVEYQRKLKEQAARNRKRPLFIVGCDPDTGQFPEIRKDMLPFVEFVQHRQVYKVAEDWRKFMTSVGNPFFNSDSADELPVIELMKGDELLFETMEEYKERIEQVILTTGREWEARLSGEGRKWYLQKVQGQMEWDVFYHKQNKKEHANRTIDSNASGEPNRGGAEKKPVQIHTSIFGRAKTYLFRFRAKG